MLLFYRCWQKTQDPQGQKQSTLLLTAQQAIWGLFTLVFLAARGGHIDAYAWGGLHFRRGILSLRNLPFYSK